MRRSILGRLAIVGALVFLGIGGLGWWAISSWGQRPDLTFLASMPPPLSPPNGPRVLFDRAHFNSHSLDAGYAAFAALLRHDGFRLLDNTNPFSASTLQSCEILVIVNSRGSNQSGRRGDPAFSPAEVDAVYQWVSAGGSLLFVADHAPYGSAARPLAARFGVDMSNTHTHDPVDHDPATGDDLFLLFSRENGLLGRHSIMEGRGPAERIRRILTFDGQSLQGPPDAAVLLRLSDHARDQLPDKSSRAATGRAQGLAVKIGNGRLVVLGEAAMLTAQTFWLPFMKTIYAGFNRADMDDKQFTLNIMHWLARTLD